LKNQCCDVIFVVYIKLQEYLIEVVNFVEAFLDWLWNSMNVVILIPAVLLVFREARHRQSSNRFSKMRASPRAEMRCSKVASGAARAPSSPGPERAPPSSVRKTPSQLPPRGDAPLPSGNVFQLIHLFLCKQSLISTKWSTRNKQGMFLYS